VHTRISIGVLVSRTSCTRRGPSINISGDWRSSRISASSLTSEWRREVMTLASVRFFAVRRVAFLRFKVGDDAFPKDFERHGDAGKTGQQKLHHHAAAAGI